MILAVSPQPLAHRALAGDLMMPAGLLDRGEPSTLKILNHLTLKRQTIPPNHPLLHRHSRYTPHQRANL
jgi:hypothetical protein